MEATNRPLSKVGMFVVGWLDVLNQRQALVHWEKEFVERRDRAAITSAIAGCYGPIYRLRSELEFAMSNFKTPLAKEEAVIGSFSPEHRGAATEYLNSDLRQFAFGDTVVFYGPCDHESGVPSLKNVACILTTLADFFPAYLNKRIALRGAIEAGHGLLVEERELYGPVFFRAHQLESKFAEYPRILIGPVLREILRSASQLPVNTPSVITTMAGLLGRVLFDMIAVDDDDKYILDYMSEGRGKGMGSDFRVVMEGAALWVHQEHQRFIREGDQKHAPRYERLNRYIQSRLPHWTTGHTPGRDR